ncbi:hypothetical protein Nos7107_3098 [Nostoc sp. PCC 7107]|nr:hypothetical protein Nos7107_3098 [Nostoc sp. PCC 7107]
MAQYGSVKKTKSQQNQQMITQPKRKNDFAGGLGDATVTQSGAWGILPQILLIVR